MKTNKLLDLITAERLYEIISSDYFEKYVKFFKEYGKIVKIDKHSYDIFLDFAKRCNDVLDSNVNIEKYFLNATNVIMAQILVIKFTLSMSKKSSSIYNYYYNNIYTKRILISLINKGLFDPYSSVKILDHYITNTDFQQLLIDTKIFPNDINLIDIKKISPIIFDNLVKNMNESEVKYMTEETYIKLSSTLNKYQIVELIKKHPSFIEHFKNDIKYFSNEKFSASLIGKPYKKYIKTAVKSDPFLIVDILNEKNGIIPLYNSNNLEELKNLVNYAVSKNPVILAEIFKYLPKESFPWLYEDKFLVKLHSHLTKNKRFFLLYLKECCRQNDLAINFDKKDKSNQKGKINVFEWYKSREWSIHNGLISSENEEFVNIFVKMIDVNLFYSKLYPRFENNVYKMNIVQKIVQTIKSNEKVKSTLLKMKTS